MSSRSAPSAASRAIFFSGIAAVDDSAGAGDVTRVGRAGGLLLGRPIERSLFARTLRMSHRPNQFLAHHGFVLEHDDALDGRFELLKVRRPADTPQTAGAFPGRGPFPACCSASRTAARRIRPAHGSSLRRCRSGGSVRQTTFSRKNRASRNLPSATARSRSRSDEAMTRTSTRTASREPRRAKPPSSRTRWSRSWRPARQLADPVQEQRAVVCELEPAGLVLPGAGNGAALTAEQLGLEHLGKRRAIDLDERTIASDGRAVNGARDELLAGPPLAAEQNRDVSLGYATDEVRDRPEGRPMPCGADVMHDPQRWRARGGAIGPAVALSHGFAAAAPAKIARRAIQRWRQQAGCHDEVTRD